MREREMTWDEADALWAGIIIVEHPDADDDQGDDE